MLTLPPRCSAYDRRGLLLGFDCHSFDSQPRHDARLDRLRLYPRRQSEGLQARRSRNRRRMLGTWTASSFLFSSNVRSPFLSLHREPTPLLRRRRYSPPTSARIPATTPSLSSAEVRLRFSCAFLAQLLTVPLLMRRKQRYRHLHPHVAASPLVPPSSITHTAHSRSSPLLPRRLLLPIHVAPLSLRSPCRIPLELYSFSQGPLRAPEAFSFVSLPREGGKMENERGTIKQKAEGDTLVHTDLRGKRKTSANVRQMRKRRDAPKPGYPSQQAPRRVVGTRTEPPRRRALHP